MVVGEVWLGMLVGRHFLKVSDTSFSRQELKCLIKKSHFSFRIPLFTTIPNASLDYFAFTSWLPSIVTRELSAPHYSRGGSCALLI